MKLADKELCTACGNCQVVCKKQSISFLKDGLNNIYPIIDKDKCVECGLCHNVCPSLNRVSKNKPTRCYSCYSSNSEIRDSSASGGVAQTLYNYCLENHFVFSGVYFDNANLKAEHKIGTVSDDIKKFINSKYTFSFMGSVAEDIVAKLKNVENVLFIGLPCQVAAVKKYLEQKKVDDTGLLTVDIVCHGVPSHEYLKEHVKDTLYVEKVDELLFRDRRFKTSKFVFSVSYLGKYYHKYVESNDNYQIGYHNATIYRPNCYKCIYANNERVGDITIGDFSGLGKIEPVNGNLSEIKYLGVSCVLVNSSKGKEQLEEMVAKKYLISDERPLDEALLYENQLKQPSIPSTYRTEFERLYPQVGFTKTCNTIFNKEKIKRPVIHIIKKCIKSVLRRK